MDHLCDHLITRIEYMRHALKYLLNHGTDPSRLELFAESVLRDSDKARERELEEAIRQAVLRLERTKEAFKSRQVKSIREDLLDVLQEHI